MSETEDKLARELTEQRSVTETVPEFFKKWRKSKVFDSLDDNLKICVEDAWEFAAAYAESRLAEVSRLRDEWKELCKDRERKLADAEAENATLRAEVERL